MLATEYGIVSIRRLLGYIACLAIIELAASNKCLSREAVKLLVSRHGSALLECHFVPFDFCTIQTKFNAPHRYRGQNPGASLMDVIRTIDFELTGKNLFLEPGEYKADLVILDDISNIVAACPMILRIKVGRIIFQRPREEASPPSSCLSPLKADDMFTISSERIPFIVMDASVGSGRLGITLNDGDSPLAESVAELAPTGGCWYDEPSCVAK